MKKIFFALLVILFLGFAFQKVFSLNLEKVFTKQEIVRTEKELLLSDLNGTLSEPEAKKVIRQLEVPIAKTYTVGRNEWLEKIAKEFGVPSISIRSTNNLEDPSLRPGQQITAQNKEGIMVTAKKDEPLESVIQTYEKLRGKRDEILAANALDEITVLKEHQLYLREGSTIWIPRAQKSFPWMSRPVFWQRISSFFGFRKHPILKVRKFHDGYDMVAAYGAPVYAGEQGVVTYTGWLGGYGNAIEIRHATTSTRYGHLSKINVEVGQKVKRKQLIGRVGSSGLSTGPHLHFEVWRNSDGKLQNPRKYLF